MKFKSFRILGAVSANTRQHVRLDSWVRWLVVTHDAGRQFLAFPSGSTGGDPIMASYRMVIPVTSETFVIKGSADDDSDYGINQPQTEFVGFEKYEDAQAFAHSLPASMPYDQTAPKHQDVTNVAAGPFVHGVGFNGECDVYNYGSAGGLGTILIADTLAKVTAGVDCAVLEVGQAFNNWKGALYHVADIAGPVRMRVADHLKRFTPGL